MILAFKQWIEDSISLYPTLSDDHEINGLARGLAYCQPIDKPPKSRASKRVDKLFGKESADVGDYGAGFVFTDGKSILLLKRSQSSSDSNTWCLPGGGAKGRETPLETAKRESKEEIGVRTKGKTFHKSVEAQGHWIFFLNRVDKPFKCKLNKEHTDWEWIALDKIKSYTLHPELKKKINSYIASIKKEFKTNT